MTPRTDAERAPAPLGEQERRSIAEFERHYRIQFNDPELLKLALTHRSYLSVTGGGPRESNERLEFLGDSVLGLVTSEFLYREHPTEHEGQLTKTKSLLVSKAILSRRGLAMGLGRFVLMSHSEVESGGRQRLSIVADAFEAVVGAIYLDQGFEAARAFIERWLLRDSREIAADKRHTNYKSHLQEYVQSTFRTHPVYRIRSEMGPDHSKQFMVEVMVGKRVLGQGRGRNKKEAEQAAARDALEKVGGPREDDARDDHEERPERLERERFEPDRAPRDRGERNRVPEVGTVTLDEDEEPGAVEAVPGEGGDSEEPGARRRRRGRRGGRGRRREAMGGVSGEPVHPAAEPASEPSPMIAPEPVGKEAIAEPRVRPERRERRPRVERMARPAPPEREIPAPAPIEYEPMPPAGEEDDLEEVGRPEGPLEDRHIDPYGYDAAEPATEPEPPVPVARRQPEPPAPRREPEPEVETWLEPEPVSAQALADEFEADGQEEHGPEPVAPMEREEEEPVREDASERTQSPEPSPAPAPQFGRRSRRGR